jgi:hypothetical protein
MFFCIVANDLRVGDISLLVLRQGNIAYTLLWAGFSMFQNPEITKVDLNCTTFL